MERLGTVMTKTKIGYLIVAVAMILLGSVSAEPSVGSEAKAAITMSPEQYSPEQVVAELQTEYDLWLEAVLAGDDQEADRLEKNLLGMVNYDILVGREQVREMARAVALSAEVDEGQPTGSDEAKDGSADQKEFSRAIACLNIRETLCRSLDRTDAFSNKYRLLGDYIDLLRRELKMPRLKLAVSRKTSLEMSGGTSPGVPGRK